MIPGYILLIMLVGHFYADFVTQSHKQATNKATSKKYLTMHVLTYSFAITAFIVFFLPIQKTFLFLIITFLAHWITDYFTSKLARKYFDKKDYHNGFVVVGADQMLHYIQLYLTFQILS
jgi:hypothetical protein